VVSALLLAHHEVGCHRHATPACAGGTRPSRFPDSTHILSWFMVVTWERGHVGFGALFAGPLFVVVMSW
jgi:hypothetical protein